jgi:hypothetical protein
VATAINPWIIAISVTLATFMEVLDTRIANVALPHIAGSLSAWSRHPMHDCYRILDEKSKRGGEIAVD